MKKIIRYIATAFLLGFGLLTLFLSMSIIFDLFNIRIKEGNYVLFVVHANFICSILYLFAAYGFYKMKNWSYILLGLASIILVLAFINLKIYIGKGGIYEIKTVGAMIFRLSLTVIFTFIGIYTIRANKT